jgi:hypothetical protein
MEQYLPQLTPFIVGIAGFLIGLVIAFRQYIQRKRIEKSASGEAKAA